MAKHVSLSPRAITSRLPHVPGSFSPRNALPSFGGSAVQACRPEVDRSPTPSFRAMADAMNRRPRTSPRDREKPEASCLHADRCPAAPAGNPMLASFPRQRSLCLAYARALLGLLSGRSVTTRTPQPAADGNLFHGAPLRLVEESAIEVGLPRSVSEPFVSEVNDRNNRMPRARVCVGVGQLISRRRFRASMSRTGCAGPATLSARVG
jgi:hypothetical protein